MLDSIDGGTPKRMVTMEFLHHLSSPQEPEVVPRRRRVDVDVDDWRAGPGADFLCSGEYLEQEYLKKAG